MSYVKISKKKCIEKKHLYLLATSVLSNFCMLSGDRTQVTD